MTESEKNLRSEVQRLVAAAVNNAKRRGEAPKSFSLPPHIYADGRRGWAHTGEESLIAKTILRAIERGEHDESKYRLSTFVYSRVGWALLDLRRTETQGGLTGEHDAINRAPKSWDSMTPAAKESEREGAFPAPYEGAAKGQETDQLTQIIERLPDKPRPLRSLMLFLLERDYDFLAPKSTPLLGAFADLHKVTPRAVGNWYREALTHFLWHRPLPAPRRGASIGSWPAIARDIAVPLLCLDWRRIAVPWLPSWPYDDMRLGDSTWPVQRLDARGFRRPGEKWQTDWSKAARDRYPGILAEEAYRRAWEKGPPPPRYVAAPTEHPRADPAQIRAYEDAHAVALRADRQLMSDILSGWQWGKDQGVRTGQRFGWPVADGSGLKLSRPRPGTGHRFGFSWNVSPAREALPGLTRRRWVECPSGECIRVSFCLVDRLAQKVRRGYKPQTALGGGVRNLAGSVDWPTRKATLVAAGMVWERERGWHRPGAVMRAEYEYEDPIDRAERERSSNWRAYDDAVRRV